MRRPWPFLTAAGFAVMFAGGWVDMVVGGICAALTLLVPRFLGRRDSGGMSSVLLGGILCALIPLVFHALTGLGVVEAMIASAIMPLVPGLSMTNAVQDLLRGRYGFGCDACGARRDDCGDAGWRRTHRYAHEQLDGTGGFAADKSGRPAF